MSKLLFAAPFAVLLAGCDAPDEPPPPADLAALRIALFNQCMNALPAGPRATTYNDWDEVVDECDSTAFYQANQCRADPASCMPDTLLSERSKQP